MHLIILCTIGLVGRMFTNGPGDQGSILGRVIPKTQKWYLMPPCLTLSTLRYGSRVKWSNPENGLSVLPYISVQQLLKRESQDRPRQVLANLLRYIYIYIYTKHSARTGCNRRRILKQCLSGLNLKFNFSLTGCHTKVEKSTLLFTWRENSWTFSRGYQHNMKCKEPRSEFKLKSPCPLNVAIAPERFCSYVYI